ncbi:hypothetical protein [Acidaminococcus timonensis]|uniref:hypothetical protein n=1 Tax=Acidaminococcus timonensis TaxID=1871002 RepID=UPI00115FE3BD|nr:hypothetical protein [Acidaminococcus timonensis]
MMKHVDLKNRFKKATSLFVLGVTLILGASALSASEAQAAVPRDNGNPPRMERRNSGDQQKAFEKRQKEIQKKREAEARKRREAQRKNRRKRPPVQQRNHQPDQRPESMPWNR